MTNPFSAKAKKTNPFAAKVKGTEKKTNPFAAKVSTREQVAHELEGLDEKIERARIAYEESLSKALKGINPTQVAARFDVSDRNMRTLLAFSSMRKQLIAKHAKNNGHADTKEPLWTERRKSGVKAKRSKNVQAPRHERPADKPAAKTGAKPFKSRTAAARKRKRG